LFFIVVCRSVADGGFEESQLYFTTSFEKKQAGKAGKARETPDHPLTSCPEPAGQRERMRLFLGAQHNLYVRPNRFPLEKT
jgi:hypothetical protein